MMTMEAELRALRDELSNRSSLASNTSSQATLKDKEDANTLVQTPENDSEVKKENNGSGEKSHSGNTSSTADQDYHPPDAKKAKTEDTADVNNDSAKTDIDENKNSNKTT